MKSLLKPEMVADILSVETNTVYQMKQRGELPFVRVAKGGVRFHPDDIDDYIKNNRHRIDKNEANK